MIPENGVSLCEWTGEMLTFLMAGVSALDGIANVSPISANDQTSRFNVFSSVTTKPRSGVFDKRK